MLVLTRRVGETIVIGKDGDITATILGVKGNQVKLGLNAPDDVPVHREEIYKRIRDENGQVRVEDKIPSLKMSERRRSIDDDMMDEDSN